MKTSRRAFIKTSMLGGVALVLGFDGTRHLIRAAALGDTYEFKPNGWIRIDENGAITLTIGKSEMGQGVHTSLAMILADELEADWARISVVQAVAGAWAAVGKFFGRPRPARAKCSSPRRPHGGMLILRIATR